MSSSSPISANTIGGKDTGTRRPAAVVTISASAPSSPSRTAMAGTEISGGEAVHTTSAVAMPWSRSSAPAAA